MPLLYSVSLVFFFSCSIVAMDRTQLTIPVNQQYDEVARTQALANLRGNRPETNPIDIPNRQRRKDASQSEAEQLKDTISPKLPKSTTQTPGTD